MFRILMVCTGNTCRSPMAEWILRRGLEEAGLGGLTEVQSAGLAAMRGEGLSPGAARALSKRGIVAQDHAAEPVTDGAVASADVVLTMTRGHKRDLLARFPEADGKVWTLREYAAGPDGVAALSDAEADIPDPFGGGEGAYESAAARIGEACVRVAHRLARDLDGEAGNCGGSGADLGKG